MLQRRHIFDFFEKKIKVNGLCAKEQTVVDREQAMAIVKGAVQCKLPLKVI